MTLNDVKNDFVKHSKLNLKAKIKALIEYRSIKRYLAHIFEEDKELRTAVINKMFIADIIDEVNYRKLQEENNSYDN